MANFEWALAQLKAGKKVRQQWWVSGTYIYAESIRIVYHSVSTGDNDWQPGYGLCCVFADDWELYDDRPPLDGTFGSAMTAVSQGHKVMRAEWCSWIAGTTLDGILKRFDGAGLINNYSPTLRDIKATDWKYYD